MGILSRRSLPVDLAPVHAAFLSCAAHVDLGQRAMIRCVPSSARTTPLPLEVGAQTLRLSLVEARAAMPAWRHRDLEESWQTCLAALDETARRMDNAVGRAGATRELEVALTAVQDLLDPLHSFVDAEAHFAALRRRR